MRAIDADALQKEYMHEHDGKRLMLIDVAPTIEPRCETCEAFNKTRLLIPQPERKKGKWIYNSPVTMKCDQCGLVIKDWDWHRFKFCPNCDCDMRGEENG